MKLLTGVFSVLKFLQALRCIDGGTETINFHASLNNKRKIKFKINKIQITFGDYMYYNALAVSTSLLSIFVILKTILPFSVCG